MCYRSGVGIKLFTVWMPVKGTSFTGKDICFQLELD